MRGERYAKAAWLWLKNRTWGVPGYRRMWLRDTWVPVKRPSWRVPRKAWTLPLSREERAAQEESRRRLMEDVRRARREGRIP